jgi:hypothetical protein
MAIFRWFHIQEENEKIQALNEAFSSHQPGSPGLQQGYASWLCDKDKKAELDGIEAAVRQLDTSYRRAVIFAAAVQGYPLSPQ